LAGYFSARTSWLSGAT